jgi:hypothetical protein
MGVGAGLAVSFTGKSGSVSPPRTGWRMEKLSRWCGRGGARCGRTASVIGGETPSCPWRRLSEPHFGLMANSGEPRPARRASPTFWDTRLKCGESQFGVAIATPNWLSAFLRPIGGMGAKVGRGSCQGRPTTGHPELPREPPVGVSRSRGASWAQSAAEKYRWPRCSGRSFGPARTRARTVPAGAGPANSD